MKTFRILGIIAILLMNIQFVKGQGVDLRGYELMGKNQETIMLKQTFTVNSEIFPFNGKILTIFGLAVKADITFTGEKGLVRIILLDQTNNEYLVYEAYPLLEDKSSFSINNLGEETGILNAVNPKSIRIETTDAIVSVQSITYSTVLDAGTDVKKESKDKKQLRNNSKINQINKSITAKGLSWAAGNTDVSELTYSEKKKLFGQSTFPAGIEYYAGGVISAGDGLKLKSASASSSMVDTWDWRSRHGKNWITDVKNQGSCGSCWAFAATGATEALVNLFYNQPLNMNLSEQNLLSCSGAGSCSGGYPSIALDYIKNTGIIDEAAFPYTATDQVCTNKSSSPTDQMKIGGRVDFGSSAYPVSEDNLKKMIIKYGPVSGGLIDWSHAMTLVGWQVVKEGDRFFYRDLNKSTYWWTVPAGSALIGKTVWIFKNSWGVWGDGGYVYVETSITNFAWTHALVAPVQSLKQNYTVQCVDNDHDGYYWWGLGPKPANCPPCPDAEDGNDADATLGPLDSNGFCIPLVAAAPVTDFTANITSITANGSVNFTDLSANTPTTWSWSFPGGTPATSTAKNPVVSYATAGTYDVTLVATNSTGSGTKIKVGYVTVTAPIPAPVADFTANITSITATGSVNFTDLSANTPTTWSWSFPGGTPATSTAQNPVVSYANTGTYDVTLVATNSTGSSTKTKTGYVAVTTPTLVPVADFTANITSITATGSVNFTDLSANTPTSWSWTFDGGTPATSTSVNPSVSYKTAGKYNVTLVATNAGGNSTKIKSGYVTVNSILSTYCTSKGNASKEWINQVSMNGTSFSSTSSGTAGYADQTSYIFNVIAGNTYSLSITPKFSGKANYEGISVWIDFNHDFDFTDAGDQVMSANNIKTSLSGNISIPATALTGTTRMRVSMKRSAIPSPCETFAYGEVEDYTINISAAAVTVSLKSANIENTIPIQKGSFMIYPNPVNQVLNLKLDQVFDQDEYSIFSVLGALISKNSLNSNLTQIDMSGLPAGLYVVKVKNGDQSFQEKFIKR